MSSDVAPPKNGSPALRIIAGLVVLLVWAFDNLSPIFGLACGVEWWVHMLLFAVIAALFPEGIERLVLVLRERNGRMH